MTSAIEFGVVSAPPGTPRPQQVVAAMAQRLGTGLFLRNQQEDPVGYRYRPVEGPLDVRDVLKASHAAQFAYRDTRMWIGSAEQRVVDGVAKAAAMRVAGYEMSPWVWSRHTEEAIGFAPEGGWRPPGLEGVAWIPGLEDFTARWAGARVALVTCEAMEMLPELPVRPRVYLVADAAQAAVAIVTAALSSSMIESVLVWPEAAGWLRSELLI